MSQSESTRYIIIGMARSGTTVTHRAVYGHPNVCAMVDEFRVAPFFTQGIASFTVGGVNRWEREHGYLNLFDAVTLFPAHAPDPEGKRLIGYCGTPEHPKEEIRAHGLKVATNGAEDARQLVSSLREFFPGLKVIRVDRDDWVAQYASLLRAQKSGQWHSWSTADRKSEDVRFAIDPAHFGAYIDDALAIHSAFDELDSTHDVARISYEDRIATTDPDRFGSLFDFLGVRRLEPVWIHSSKVAPPLEQFVSNVDAMRGVLAERRAKR